MHALTLPGRPPIEIEIRRSKRARRYSLRISNDDGQVSLTLPVGAPLNRALDFAKSRESWIRGKLMAHPAQLAVRFGDDFPYLGKHLPLRRALGKTSRAQVDGILIAASDRALGVKLKAFCKVIAREHLSARVDIHAARLGKRVSRLTLRDPKSRWGSCTGDGKLMFSWRLIMAPPDVLDYVAAHEVAHLQEMNHSVRFWDVVGRLKPDFEPHRAWLKKNGRELLRYRL